MDTTALCYCKDIKLRKGLKSLNLSIFIIKNFYYVINYLYINHVTIYRAKCLAIVTLKILPTTCFRYASEEVSSKFSIPKMKLNRILMSFPVQVLLKKCSEDFE